MQRRTGGTSRKSDWSSRSFSIFGWLGVCLCKSQTRWSLLRGFPSGRVGDWKYCRQFEDVKLRGYHISMMDVYFFSSISLSVEKFLDISRTSPGFGLSEFSQRKIPRLDGRGFPIRGFIPPLPGLQPQGRLPKSHDLHLNEGTKGKFLAKTTTFFWVLGGSPHL